jgi:hypothetical protein
MSSKIIMVADLTDHCGKVISGSPTHDIGNMAVARLGDEVPVGQHSAQLVRTQPQHGETGARSVTQTLLDKCCVTCLFRTSTSNT